MASSIKVIKKFKVAEEIDIKDAHLFKPSLESLFDELKSEIMDKIDKELENSANAREYIAQKYGELCRKIQYLTELEAMVAGFRNDVKTIGRQITDLSMRVDDIEMRALSKECPHVKSAMFFERFGH